MYINCSGSSIMFNVHSRLQLTCHKGDEKIMTLLNEVWFDCFAFMKIILDAIGRGFVSYDIYVMLSIIV